MMQRLIPQQSAERAGAGQVDRWHGASSNVQVAELEGRANPRNDGLRSLLSVLAMVARHEPTASLQHILEAETDASIVHASQIRIRSYLQGLIANVETDARLAALRPDDRRVLDDAVIGLRDALEWSGWNKPLGTHIADAASAIALAERIIDKAGAPSSRDERRLLPDRRTHSASTSQRIEWLDRARGIGIILVVFGHVERGLATSDIVHGYGWALTDFVLYCFHMPLFMFISGLNVDGSLRHGRPTFLKSKILSIAYPYILWSLLQGMILFYAGSLANTPKGLDDLARIAWDPMSQFWFLYALFAFMVAAAFLDARMQLVIAVVAYLVIDLVPMDNIVSKLMHFMVFFALGRVMATYKDAMRPRTDVAAAALLILAFNAVLLFRQGGISYDSTLALPSAISGLVVVLWLSQRMDKAPMLTFLGSMSMAIYLMHILAGAGARIVMLRMLHVPPLAAIYVPICTIAGIGVPILGYFVAKRLGMLGLFGLTIGQRGRRWIERSQAPAK